MNRIEPYEPSEATPEFHAVVSVSLGELVEDGFIDWTDDGWHWDAYDDEQYNRLNAKLEAHYWDREIGVLPPGAWKREFVRKMNEIMPKYKLAYQAAADGITLMRVGDDYGKSRTIGSSFPATQLKPNQDYASDANDNEYETVHEGDYLDRINLLKAYDDIDLQIINEMETMFTCLMTVNINI